MTQVAFDDGYGPFFTRYWILNGPRMFNASAILPGIFNYFLERFRVKFWGGMTMRRVPTVNPCIFDVFNYGTNQHIFAIGDSVALNFPCFRQEFGNNDRVVLRDFCGKLQKSTQLLGSLCTRIAAPDRTYEGRTRTGYPTWLAKASAAAVAR